MKTKEIIFKKIKRTTLLDSKEEDKIREALKLSAKNEYEYFCNILNIPLNSIASHKEKLSDVDYELRLRGIKNENNI